MRFVFVLVSCLCCAFSFAQVKTEEIAGVISGKRASVGVAVLYDGKAWTVNNDGRYPLMSVFKFHVAVAALKKMERENIGLDDMLWIEPEQIRQNTYSPLAKKYPDQRIRISYRDLITYTVAYSDNNTCDWLISFAGGTGEVEAYIRSLGMDGFSLKETEQSMEEDISRSYRNWSTPLAMARLLEKVYTEDVLQKPHFLFLETVMKKTATGRDKIKAGLPAGVVVGHKTGHSYRTQEGLRISEADAGVIYLPNGRKCYLVVLIRDSMESDAVNARIIADISRVVYRRVAGFSSGF